MTRVELCLDKNDTYYLSSLYPLQWSKFISESYNFYDIHDAAMHLKNRKHILDEMIIKNIFIVTVENMLITDRVCFNDLI